MLIGTLTLETYFKVDGQPSDVTWSSLNFLLHYFLWILAEVGEKCTITFQLKKWSLSASIDHLRTRNMFRGKQNDVWCSYLGASLFPTPIFIPVASGYGYWLAYTLLSDWNQIEIALVEVFEVKMKVSLGSRNQKPLLNKEVPRGSFHWPCYRCDHDQAAEETEL